MVAHAGPAKLAFAAAEVDLADHAAVEKPFVVAFLDHTDELVSEHAAVAHVALDDFEVGIADAGEPYADERFARAAARFGMVPPEFETAVEE
jgi:hypothetical protein